MERMIHCSVNGQARSVTTDSKRPLLEVLREEFHLTGTKYGCGEGQCRACTVLVNGQPVSACITPIEAVDNQKIVTIEGLDPKGLHPVQQAFLSEGAFQCGYCTSGMIVALSAYLKQSPKPATEEVLGRMQGHICRCGTYARIAKAITKLNR
jgi:aerobic-type carbon monoxide dehydrogenase small subunit (CoxS/CutS family)